MNAIIPIPKIPITVRPATMDDLSFIDGLQKKHTKQVGFMPTKQFEGKIKLGHVLVAEEPPPQPSPGVPEEGEDYSLPRYSGGGLGRGPVGYLIGHDQYFKHDDIGIIYQINIAESHRRSLVAATLLKAQFDRSAYGCKLYCCWCAQDIEANRFWESMGFVPLAFRAGSAAKSRVHIFWQKRIRQGDTTTPYWFPANTTGGSIREDRIVLPIPPGTHWSDAKPRILPALSKVEGPQGELDGKTPRQIEGRVGSRGKRRETRPVIQSGAVGIGFLKFKGAEKPKPEKPPRVRTRQAEERLPDSPRRREIFAICGWRG